MTFLRPFSRTCRTCRSPARVGPRPHSQRLGDNTVLIFVLRTDTRSSAAPEAASQAPVSLHLPAFALLALHLSELGGGRNGLAQEEALLLRVRGRGAGGAVLVFVATRLEGQRGVGGPAVSLHSPVQGVESRPVGTRPPGAPLCSWVWGGATAPRSPLTALVAGGSIW